MVDDDYDDFSTTPPHNVRGKQQQRCAISDSLPHKKHRLVSVTDSTVRKQSARNEPLTTSKDASTSRHRDVQTTTKTDEVKLLRQEFQAFKNDVSAQFTELNKSIDDIRKCIDDNFKRVVEAIKGNQTSEKELTIIYIIGKNMKLAGTMLTGDVSGVGMRRSTQRGDTLKASTEEIQGSGETPLKPTHPQGEVVIVHTHVPVPAVQQGGVNDNAEFSASEQMVAELLIQCPLDTVIPLGPPAIQVNDQADPYMFKTPQSSKVENVVPNSQWLIPDDELPSQLGVQQTTGQGSTAEIAQPSIENTKRRMIVHPSIVRDRKPSKYTVSDFMPNYSSAGSSARSSVPIKFEKKHPFVEHPINAPVDMTYFQEYENCLKKDLLLRHDKKRDKENHYRKNKELVDPEDADMSLKLGVTLVKDKNWFYLLSMEGKLWNDEHLDVIFYYLRKKGKYEDNITYKYTTVSCILHTIITEIYHAWKNPESSTSVASKESDVCEYINGYRLMGNVPWHTVDNVLIPVNVKEENH
ncbi:uncharacterized protein LOC132637427 [Lycium barbarum]|uniref:uncharacterized protein LOC132637427 n=1 Tax=Lycium barbarum TaxID=112863 RepID=UPI00293E865F|nr:uncharacterized protein LOC132637427 [Lycium barbarum]